ncbi:MAG: PHP domain-containing protein [Bacteroidales bacterium]
MFQIEYPSGSELEKEIKRNVPLIPLKVNAHVHSPYSFSAFESIEQAVKLAHDEGIKVLGINDFFVTDGYEEFARNCIRSGIFPLFNIEFIGLNRDDQQKGIKVNDPTNPGRTYMSGKGLSYPQLENPENKKMLEGLKHEASVQILSMIDKLNALIGSLGADFRISETEILNTIARNLVRERHLAKMLRIKVTENFSTENEQVDFFTKLYGGKKPSFSLSDSAAFENEIRNNLLKAGGSAFVPETEKAFPVLEQICNYIINAGGIPTYPILGDDAKGNFTEFEADVQQFGKILLERGIFSVEFIPNRNTLAMLSKYAEYLYDIGFVVSFGTEHNTPALTPLEVSCRDSKLSEKLLEINYKGACVIAAHQYLKSSGLEGYIDKSGKWDRGKRDSFEKLGNVLILNMINR